MLTAAVATFALGWASTYLQVLIAALGVGVAGGSFAVGVAYVSRFYDDGRQGTALGIFGVGNVGAAVTKFVAPFVMVAVGWQATAQIWAVALAVTAILFWLLGKDDPVTAARREGAAPRRGLKADLAPLKNLQVWRFSAYYFFSFGAFVALALWLPHYLIGAYGLDVKTAGMVGAGYSIPASIFRTYGGAAEDLGPRGADRPCIYRLYEIVGAYGLTVTSLINEEFGNGIMSAIDFSMHLDRKPHPKSDRVRITMSGKYLSNANW
ncbi:MFS transporter [Paracoccus rhizosphaerae]